MFGFLKLPYCLAFWACSGTLAPAIGPIVAGYSITAKDWRWSQWELLWLSGPILILLFTLLPETSSDTILLRRVVRLRKLTSDGNLRSQSEIKMQHMTAKQMAFNTLVKPWEMNALDPAILFTTVYCSLTYAIFYSFFEVFPFVFPVMYGFDLGQSGLAFLCVPVGVLIAVPIGLLHYGTKVEPRLVKEGFPAPEVWLRPGLIGSFLVTIGLFIFGERTCCSNVLPSADISSLVRPFVDTLDRPTHRSGDQPNGLLRYLERSLHLPSQHLPQIRSITVCG